MKLFINWKRDFDYISNIPLDRIKYPILFIHALDTKSGRVHRLFAGGL
jgi:hypothetical protein